MAAAEFHEGVAPAGLDLRGRWRRRPRATSPSRNSSTYFMRLRPHVDAGLGHQGEGLLGFFRVEPGERIADVDDHVVAHDHAVDSSSEIVLHAAEVNDGLAVGKEFDHAGRDGETHSFSPRQFESPPPRRALRSAV